MLKTTHSPTASSETPPCESVSREISKGFSTPLWSVMVVEAEYRLPFGILSSDGIRSWRLIAKARNTKPTTVSKRLLFAVPTCHLELSLQSDHTGPRPSGPAGSPWLRRYRGCHCAAQQTAKPTSPGSQSYHRSPSIRTRTWQETAMCGQRLSRVIFPQHQYSSHI